VDEVVELPGREVVRDRDVVEGVAEHVRRPELLGASIRSAFGREALRRRVRCLVGG
jgi:hypothetical protein